MQDNKTLSIVGNLNRVAGKIEGLMYGEKDEEIAEAMIDLVDVIDYIIQEVES